ncbi:unnamed protein product [Urochloa humidicola]
MGDDDKPKNQILRALVALTHTLYQARAAARRTTSLALLRSADGNNDADGAEALRPLSRRFSLMSPFWSKDDNEDDDTDNGDAAALLKRHSFTVADGEKESVWSWKPMCTLPHIGTQRVGCLFSVEVVAAQGLPASMNGLLLAVAVRRKEARDGAVQSMPARVEKGAADFDETLYVRCHLYCSGGGGGTGKPFMFEPLLFLLSVVAVDAPGLDLGHSSLDFSAFVKEFTDRSKQGVCPRQWDVTFPLAGKARGGDLVVKLAFQIMEGLGLVVNSQPDAAEKASSFARKVSKSSFIMMSPKMLTSKLPFMPKMDVWTLGLKDIDKFKLDEPALAAEVKAVVPVEQKKPEHKPEEVKVEQLKKIVEPELAVFTEEHKEPEHELEPEEAEEESEPKPEIEDKKSDNLELTEFEVVEKRIEEELKEKAEPELTVVKEEEEEQKEPELEHKPNEVKVEQLKETVEPELAVVKEVEQEPKHELEADEAKEEEQKKPGHVLESKETKEEEKEQKESEPEPEPETNDKKSDDPELLEFDVVDKGIKQQLKVKIDPELTVVKEEEQKEPKHELELEDAKEEEQKQLEPELAVVKEEEEKELEPELDPKEAKEDEEQNESEPEPRIENKKSDYLELLQFDVVDMGTKGQEDAEAKKALEAMMLGAMLDTATKLVEQPEAKREEVNVESLQLKSNGEEVTGELAPEANGEGVTKESIHSLKANGEAVTGESLQSSETYGAEVTGESLQASEANQEEVTGEPLQPLETKREKVTAESLQLPNANGEEETGESLDPLEANGEEVARDSLQPPVANCEEVIGETLQPLETMGEKVTRESLRPSDANGEEVTGESLHPVEANTEEVTAKSLQLQKANGKEVTRESLHPPGQGEVNVAAAKSLPQRIRWRTLAIITTPIAIIISKALAHRKQCLNLSLELRCHVTSQPNQSPHHHYVQQLFECDLQCLAPGR